MDGLNKVRGRGLAALIAVAATLLADPGICGGLFASQEVQFAEAFNFTNLKALNIDNGTGGRQSLLLGDDDTLRLVLGLLHDLVYVEKFQLESGAKATDMIEWNPHILGESSRVVVLEPGLGRVAIYTRQPYAHVADIDIPGLHPGGPGTIWDGGQGSFYISTGNGKITKVDKNYNVYTANVPGNPLQAVVGQPWLIPTPPGAAGPPSALNFTTGSDGNVWFTETLPTDANGNPFVSGHENIGRVTPDGVISEFAVPTLFAGTGSTDISTGTYIVLGPDDNVWFIERAGKLGRITPAGVITEFQLPAGTILGVQSGPDGNLWVKAYSGKIFRVTPQGVVTSFTIPTTSFGRDVSLVPGPDGALWFNEDTKIGRIMMDGTITEFDLPTPTVNATPNYAFQLAFSPDGEGTFLEFTSNSLVGFFTGTTFSRDYVQKAYVAYYGRPADPAGQDYWASRMSAEGGSLGAIINAFGNSAEFDGRYGGLGVSALVTKIYQQALARDPDAAGLDYYIGELQAGHRTLQSITLDVLNGASTPPDSTVVANKLDVATYYTSKVAKGCPYGSESDGVNILAGVTADSATDAAARTAINTRCGP